MSVTGPSAEGPAGPTASGDRPPDGPPPGTLAVLPSEEVLRWEGGPSLGSAGRLFLSALVVLFILFGLPMVMPFGSKPTVAYLLVMGVPAVFVIRLVWRRGR